MWIKKVAVTKLKQVAGAIINSFDTTVDKTTNAPSLQAVENKKADKQKLYNIILDTDWIGENAPFTKIISLENILETDIPKLYPIWSENIELMENEEKEYAKISRIISNDGTVELICNKEKPNLALNVRIEVCY